MEARVDQLCPHVCFVVNIIKVADRSSWERNSLCQTLTPPQFVDDSQPPSSPDTDTPSTSSVDKFRSRTVHKNTSRAHIFPEPEDGALQLEVLPLRPALCVSGIPQFFLKQFPRPETHISQPPQLGADLRGHATNDGARVFQTLLEKLALFQRVLVEGAPVTETVCQRAKTLEASDGFRDLPSPSPGRLAEGVPRSEHFRLGRALSPLQSGLFRTEAGDIKIRTGTGLISSGGHQDQSQSGGRPLSLQTKMIIHLTNR